MPQFKTKDIEAQWRSEIHPDLRTLLVQFDAYSLESALPTCVLTDLVRSPDEQVLIYVRFWRALVDGLNHGPPYMVDPEGDGKKRLMTVKEVDKAKEVRGKTYDELADLASLKFTWHWCRCAADIRTFHYNTAQLSMVVRWFETHTQDVGPDGRKKWEFLVHDVHGNHMHVGRKDFFWRSRFSPTPKPKGVA